MLDLTGKVVLVTGAARRVGHAITSRFAAAGCKLAVHYRSSVSEGQKLTRALVDDGHDAAGFAADLRVPAECRALVESVCQHFGGLDILVNNAAVFAHAGFLEAGDADWETAWRDSIETNLVAPARLSRECAPHLQARRGAIVNLADISGTLTWPGYVHHGVSKAGLATLTRNLAVVLGPEVRVNAVAPGIAAFPDSMPRAERDSLIARTALGRAGNPDHIADAVVFLAGHDYITGSVLPVDGGWAVPR